ncbi:hypothetical protein GGF38_004370, partial [Coemansia sp. RSA 25]
MGLSTAREAEYVDAMWSIDGHSLLALDNVAMGESPPRIISFKTEDPCELLPGESAVAKLIGAGERKWLHATCRLLLGLSSVSDIYNMAL